MSIIKVPRTPPTMIPAAAIRNGKTVTGWTWQSASDLINYLTARGSMLVCGNQPNLVVSAGSTESLRYYVWPRGIHTRRVWVLYMSAISGGSSKRAAVTLGAGGANEIEVRVPLAAPSSVLWFQIDNPPQPVFYVEPYTATTTPGEITLAIASAASAGVLVYRAMCFDVPRTRIEVDNGEDASGEAGRGFAIYQADERGLYGIAQATHAGRDNFIRANLHWYNATGFTTTSITFETVFNLGPKCLGRAMATADGATVNVTVAARLISVGGATVYARFTAASGATVTLSTTSASAVWVTGTLAIDREDLTDTDSGGQAARLFGDTITIEVSKTLAGTSGTLTGIAIGEPL